MTSSGYTIRRARPGDLAALPAIERAAAEQFRSTAFADIADAPLSSAVLNLDHDHIWVAEDGAERQVGFAIAHLHDGEAHLHELDVHPAHARRGLGSGLVRAVANWARQRGLTAVTLSTFRDIPWNGPFYARLGFVPLAEAELNPALRAIVQAEDVAGLPVSERLCMRLMLG